MADRAGAWTFPSLPGAGAVSWAQRDGGQGVNLKSCELQLPRAETILADALRELGSLDVYRYPVQGELLAAISSLWDVPGESMALTAGSSVAIAAVVDALGVPAGRLILQEPAFDAWTHFAAIRAVPAERCRGVCGPVPTTTLDAFEAALRSGPPGVAAITNPGNPLGDLIPFETVKYLVETAESHGHVLVIDDCYGAFAGARHLELLAEHPRLLVIRSLSKSWAMAGARLGVVFGSPAIIGYLQRFRLDSAVSALALRLATRLCARTEDLRALWQDVREIRDWFTAQVVAARPTWVALPSTTNFVTIRTAGPGGGARAAAYLAANGVRVRALEDVDGFEGCFRLSMAGRDVMQRVLDLLQTAENPAASGTHDAGNVR